MTAGVLLAEPMRVEGAGQRVNIRGSSFQCKINSFNFNYRSKLNTYFRNFLIFQGKDSLIIQGEMDILAITDFFVAFVWVKETDNSN